MKSHVLCLYDRQETPSTVMGLPMLGATIMDDCDGTADVVLEERYRNLLYGYLDIPEQTLSAAVYCEAIIPLTSPPHGALDCRCRNGENDHTQKVYTHVWTSHTRRS